MAEEENVVKLTCKKLGITQKELAERLGVSKPTVERWAQDEVPAQAQNQVELLLENHQLKKELEELKSAIKTIAKHAQ
ncbi:MAG: helix-turn-helix domain-containing protein [Campylobacterales bacterium]|nr:helix-turn-helix domain-containing protein [Campylobacterales bacterium]